jgi:integrase
MAYTRPRGDGYEICVSCGYDSHGKRIKHYRYWSPEEGMTQKQAEKELNRQAVLFEEECNNGFQTTTTKFETFAETWINDYAPLHLKSTTFERIAKVRKRVYQIIGHLRMDKITPRHIQAFVNNLSKQGANERTGEPLAPKTIKHNVTFISDVFSYAVDMGILQANPCAKVKYPRGEAKEKNVYTPEEMTSLLIKLQSEPLKYRTFFTLMAYSGFRRSEMLGLEWKDIDFATSTITLRRTSNYTKEKGTYTDTMKTKRSRRSVKFPKIVMDLLSEFKESQDEEMLTIGESWLESDRLFVQWNGEPMSNNTPYTWLKRFCERNDIRFCDIHSFRHFAASAMITSGIDLLTVSRTLGHSQPSTTSNIYGHVFEESSARASEAITSVIGL